MKMTVVPMLGLRAPCLAMALLSALAPHVDAVARGRADDARVWAGFAAQAATARGSALEATVCLDALEAIALRHPEVVGESGNLQLAELRKLGAGAEAPQARTGSAAPADRGAAQVSKGS